MIHPGDVVKIVNPNSSFCAETGVVKSCSPSYVWVSVDVGGKFTELQFYAHEVEKV